MKVLFRASRTILRIILLDIISIQCSVIESNSLQLSAETYYTLFTITIFESNGLLLQPDLRLVLEKQCVALRRKQNLTQCRFV